MTSQNIWILLSVKTSKNSLNFEKQAKIQISKEIRDINSQSFINNCFRGIQDIQMFLNIHLLKSKNIVIQENSSSKQ